LAMALNFDEKKGGELSEKSWTENKLYGPRGRLRF